MAESLSVGRAQTHPGQEPGVDLGLNTLRGLAILLLVSYHAIEQPDRPLGLVETDDWLRYFTYSTENIRMPLFTVISGFLYGMRPLDGAVRPFLAGKGRRLVFPFLVLSTLTFWLQTMTSNGTRPGDWWRIYVYPFEQYWFLPALVLVFVTVVLLERLKALSTPWRMVAVLVLAVCLRSIIGEIELFNIDGFIYLLPFFVLGCGISRFAQQPVPWLDRIALAVLVTGLALQQLVWFGSIDVEAGRDSVLGTLIGLGAGYALLRLRRPVRPLAELGRFSYPIYLFHILGIAVAVRIAAVVSVDSEPLVLPAVMVIAIGLSIGAYLALVRSPIAATVVLGERRRRRPVKPVDSHRLAEPSLGR